MPFVGGKRTIHYNEAGKVSKKGFELAFLDLKLLLTLTTELIQFSFSNQLQNNYPPGIHQLSLRTVYCAVKSLTLHSDHWLLWSP